MIRKKQIITGTLIIILVLTSCVKEDIYNTAHPDKGQIALVVDWSKRGTGISMPQSYTVEVGTYATTISGERNTIDNLFLPDTYHALVFNTAEKIMAREAKATVSSAENGYIESLPGWLFAYAADITIEKDKGYTLTAIMEQQVRELNLFIEATGGTVGKVTSVTATLSGVAQQLNLRDGTLSTEKSVRLAFAKQADGKYKTTARLLGIVAASPKLTVKIAFAGGTPVEITQEYDLGNPLKAFNGEKNKPLSLAAQLIETPTASGFTTVITDWKIVKEGNATAD